MKKTWNGAERFALGSFTAAGRTKQDKRAVFHGTTRYTALGANREGKRLFSSDRINVDPSPAPIEADVAVDQGENCVIAAEPDVFPGEELRAALPDNDVAGHDQLAAESFYTEPFADAVAAVLNAALSFFMSHDLSLFRF
jgi:hypothetical protein